MEHSYNAILIQEKKKCFPVCTDTKYTIEWKTKQDSVYVYTYTHAYYIYLYKKSSEYICLEYTECRIHRKFTIIMRK